MKIPRKQILLSLFFPFLIIFASLVLFISYMEYFFDGDLQVRILVLSPFIGGMLSLLITAIFKIDTSKFIAYRTTIDFSSAFIYIIIVILLTSITINLSFYFLFYMPFLFIIFESTFLIFKSRKIGQIIVMILSEPWIYYTIFIFCLLMSLDCMSE